MRLAKYVALAGLMIASTAGATEANVITVEYYTTGVFSDSGTNSIGNPSTGVGISFTGVGTVGAPINVLSPDVPLFQNLGNFTVARGDNQSEFNLTGSFSLNIFQSLPTVGDDTLLGTLQGQLKAGTGKIVFAISSLTIDDVTYTLLDDELVFANPEAKNSQTFAALNGNITHRDDVIIDPNIVPEPGTLALLGLGAVAGVIRRRKSVI